MRYSKVVEVLFESLDELCKNVEEGSPLPALHIEGDCVSYVIRYVMRYLAMRLYEKGVVSLGKAAELAKTPYLQFVDFLITHGVRVPLEL